MSRVVLCSQKDCGDVACWSYTWPSGDRLHGCPDHAQAAARVAAALGTPIALGDLDADAPRVETDPVKAERAHIARWLRGQADWFDGSQCVCETLAFAIETGEHMDGVE